MSLTLQVDSTDDLPEALLRVHNLVRKGLSAGPVTVTLGRPRRTLDQNAKLWAMLADISKQVEWHGQFLSSEDWKTMATAALRRQRVVPGIEGGFVILGESTSKMTVAQFSELIEFICAFGDEKGVKWSESVAPANSESGTALSSAA